MLARQDGSHGIVAVDVTYHERLKAETPKPENLWRYREVHERSAAFRPEAFDQVKGRSVLWSPWLEHLLLLSMLQHPVGAWTWGRYVTIHAAGNVEMAERSERYAGAARGRDDVQVDDARGGARDRRPPLPHGSSHPGSLPAAVGSGCRGRRRDALSGSAEGVRDAPADEVEATP